MSKQKLIREKELYLVLEEASKRIRERVGGLSVLKKFGLSFEQWLIIEQAGKYPGISQKKIIDKLVKEAASVSRMVNKLLGKEYLYRQKNQNDKKIGQLFLTNKGETVYAECKKSVDKEFREIFSGFYERELNLIIDILKRVNRNE